MTGTREGAIKWRQSMEAHYGPNWREEMKKRGAKGGTQSIGGGFADGEAGRERARKYGAIGGKKSRRSRDSYVKKSDGRVTTQ